MIKLEVENKDGGLHPGNAYFLVAELDSNAIPTAIGMCSRSRNPTEIVAILCDQTLRVISKMAAFKPEIRISLHPD